MGKAVVWASELAEELRDLGKKADGWYRRWEQAGKNLEGVEERVDPPASL